MVKYIRISNSSTTKQILDENKVIAGKCGAIDVILNAMKTHIDSASVCFTGCGALFSISLESYFNQKEVCEKGGLIILLEVLKRYNNDEGSINLLELSCNTFELILSKEKVYSRFCTQGILNAIKECYENHKGSKRIKQSFLRLTRDAEVEDSVSSDVCSENDFTECEDKCEDDEEYSKCCVQ